MRHCRPVLLLVALAALAAPATAAAQAEPLYDERRQCVETRGNADWGTTERPGSDSPWVVYGTVSSTIRLAEQVRDGLERSRAWERISALFRAGGFFGVPAGQAEGPLQIFVSPDEFADNWAGIETTYCRFPNASVIVIARSTVVDGGEAAGATAAHEIFHAFQSAVAGGLAWGSWWHEATAEWASNLLFERPAWTLNRDDAFLRRPELPLDHRANERPESTHQYGAFRFVEWLSRRMSTRAFARMLVATFRRGGSQRSGRPRPDMTAIVAADLRRERRDLAEELGRFWAAHLDDTEANGPAGRIDPLPVGRSARRFRLRVRIRAAKLLRPRIASGVRKVRIELGPVEGGEQLWVRAGGLRRVSELDRTYCLARGSGARYPQLPSDFAIAYTNGAPDVSTFEVRTTGIASGEGCGRNPRPPATCKAAALVAGTCRPPAPPPAPCTQRRGYYDTHANLGPEQPPRVFLDVVCFRGDTINGFGGAVRCGPFVTDLYRSGGAKLVLAPIRGGRATIDYTDRDQRVTASVHFSGDTASGTVRVVAPNCDSGPVAFTAPWRRAP